MSESTAGAGRPQSATNPTQVKFLRADAAKGGGWANGRGPTGDLSSEEQGEITAIDLSKLVPVDRQWAQTVMVASNSKGRRCITAGVRQTNQAR